MPVVNVLVIGLSSKCVNVVIEDSLSVAALRETISRRQSVDASSFFLSRDGSPLEDSESVGGQGVAPLIIVRAYPTVRGGKGGFGTLIRSMGMQINKSDSRGASRDLSGRRMRDVDAEKKITKWVKDEPERKRMKEEAKRKKRQKILSRPKYFFNDPEYMEQKRSTEDNMHDALKQGMEAAAGPSSSGQGVKRKAAGATEPGPSKKRKLWLGVDEAELDSDSEEELPSPSSSPPSSSPPSPPTPRSTVPPAPETDSLNTGSAEVSSSVQGSDSLSTVSAEPETSGSQSAAPQEGSAAPQDSASMEPIDMEAYSSAAELETAGLERIKQSLQALGLKCGGTLRERAARLFSTKGRSLTELEPTLFATGGRKGKRKRPKTD